MNVAFFLTPKSEVIYLNESWSMRQVLEKMRHYRYATVPIIDDQGKYIGTISEGDLLWQMHEMIGESIDNYSKIKLNDIPLYNSYKSIHVRGEIEDLIDLTIRQNFVPIIDDLEHFIGIVTRKDIIHHLNSKLKTI
ncbi:CBS domain-containing protein [Chengkuizengella sp. SCS-71B]|uniref:CBS domain-containing protein n=1 Tax=Chengkuizengella sp. SCS-71B TaxID=3115290 RepID=UPI0032C21C87